MIKFLNTNTFLGILIGAIAIVAPYGQYFVWGSGDNYDYREGFTDGYGLCLNESQPNNVYTTVLSRNVYLFHSFDYQHNETNTNHINYNITNTYVINYDYRDLLNAIPDDPNSVEFNSVRQWLINRLEMGTNHLENYFDTALTKTQSYIDTQVSDSVNRVSVMIGKNIDELKDTFNVVDELKNIIESAVPDVGGIEDTLRSNNIITLYSSIAIIAFIILTTIIVHVRIASFIDNI